MPEHAAKHPRQKGINQQISDRARVSSIAACARELLDRWGPLNLLAIARR
ncbi:hypothetical protein N184_35125 [Sinorhizobium sp. GL28]|jgi:hypothetical protein|nr:hypothetical protein N184_35125 [Sinorhizobium sp. GL28]